MWSVPVLVLPLVANLGFAAEPLQPSSHALAQSSKPAKLERANVADLIPSQVHGLRARLSDDGGLVIDCVIDPGLPDLRFERPTLPEVR